MLTSCVCSAQILKFCYIYTASTKGLDYSGRLHSRVRNREELTQLLEEGSTEIIIKFEAVKHKVIEI